MAHEFNLSLGAAQTGLTVYANVVTSIGVDLFLCTEFPSGSGNYRASATGLDLGVYPVYFTQTTSITGTILGTGTLVWDGTKERSVNDLPTVAEIQAGLNGGVGQEIADGVAAILSYVSAPDTAATIYNYFTELDRADAFKANVSGLATVASIVDLLSYGDNNWATATGFSTFNPATDTVARVTLVDTVTTNTDMRGTDGALLAANYITPLDATATQSAAAAAITAANLSTLTAGDIATALTNYDTATNAALAGVQTAVLAGGFVASDRRALLALAYGRQRIDYSASQFTIYDVDGLVAQVFSLQDPEGNPAETAQAAVDRVPT